MKRIVAAVSAALVLFLCGGCGEGPDFSTASVPPVASTLLQNLDASETSSDAGFVNLISTRAFAGAFPYDERWPTKDTGVREAVCEPAPVTYPFQRFRVKTEKGHRYLFSAAVKGISGTRVKIELLARPADQTEPADSEKTSLPSSVFLEVFPSEFVRMAGVFRADFHGSTDFTLALAQDEKDVKWSYKEVSVTDVTDLTNEQIEALLKKGYFKTSLSRDSIPSAKPGTASSRIPSAGATSEWVLTPSGTASLLTQKWRGKSVLCLGDSLTAAGVWQRELASRLGMRVYTRATGGVALRQMVDGVDAFPALTVEDVRKRDLIIVYGGYNNRHQLRGKVGDVYPKNKTVAGELQYVLDKIKSLLREAGNEDCVLVVVTPHCVGKSSYVPYDGTEEYPPGSGQTLRDVAARMEEVARHNGVPCLNAYDKSGIDRTNWNRYAADSDPGRKGAWNDQMHLNRSEGLPLIGTVIARFVAQTEQSGDS